MSDAWRIVRLGEICNLVTGTYPTEKTTPGPYPLVVTAESFRTADSFQLEGEAVCIPTISSTGHGHASLKRIHYVSGRFAVANLLVAAMPKPGIPVDVKFLWLYLNAGRDELIVPLMQGTANVNLRPSQLADVAIALPPLAVQRRVVDIVGAVDETIDRGRELSAGAKVLLAAITEELVFRQAYPTRTLRELAVVRGVIGGPFGSSLTAHDYVSSGIPVIRGENLTTDDGYVRGPYAYVSRAKAEELRRNVALPGDIIATQRGTLGQVARVPNGVQGAYVISQSQMRLRADPELSDSGYLYYVLASHRISDQIRSQEIATANPHINLGIFAALQVPVPPIQTQRDIARTLACVDDLRIASEAKTRALERVRAAALPRLLSPAHEIPASYDRFLDGAA